MKNINEIMEEFTEFSCKTFVNADSLTSLVKLEDELKEVRELLNADYEFPEFMLIEEYADVAMCLFDSLRKRGISIESLNAAMCRKTKLCINSKWVENENHTYSRIKTNLIL
jgi:hypothetical protein